MGQRCRGQPDRDVALHEGRASGTACVRKRVDHQHLVGPRDHRRRRSRVPRVEGSSATTQQDRVVHHRSRARHRRGPDGALTAPTAGAQVTHVLGSRTSIQRSTAGSFECAYECAGAPGVLSQLADLVRAEGRVSLIAATAGAISVDPTPFVQKEIRLLGSFAYTPEDCAAAFDLISSGRVDPTHHQPPVRARRGGQGVRHSKRQRDLSQGHGLPLAACCSRCSRHPTDANRPRSHPFEVAGDCLVPNETHIRGAPLDLPVRRRGSGQWTALKTAASESDNFARRRRRFRFGKVMTTSAVTTSRSAAIRQAPTWCPASAAASAPILLVVSRVLPTWSLRLT